MSESVKEYFNERASRWDSFGDDDANTIEYFLSLLDIQEGESVLDLGCGTGVLGKQLLETPAKEILGVDVSDKMIEVAQQKYQGIARISYLCKDFYELRHEPFDHIICYNAFPHFLDVEGYVKQAYSLLKDGGTLLIAHNRGRAALDAHHAHHSQGVSRMLRPVEEEIQDFQKHDFTPLNSIDTENMFFFLLKK